jgi:NAD(P)H-dependent FMN reductase
VAPWVIDRARGHGAFDVEVLDLREWPLPMFAEHFGTIGGINDPSAYLVVTPEYNHSVPGG